jgi:hypothetical protein
LCYSERHYAERHYAERRYAERRYAERRDVEEVGVVPFKINVTRAIKLFTTVINSVPQ